MQSNSFSCLNLQSVTQYCGVSAWKVVSHNPFTLCQLFKFVLECVWGIFLRIFLMFCVLVCYRECKKCLLCDLGSASFHYIFLLKGKYQCAVNSKLNLPYLFFFLYQQSQIQCVQLKEMSETHTGSKKFKQKA